MTTSLRWTTADLEVLPFDDGKRYEIIDGELHVTTQPSVQHQLTCGRTILALGEWSAESGAGMAIPAPGLVFAPDEAVAPDVVWISKERLATALYPDGKLHVAPELVAEVLSPGAANEQRDREAKLGVYSRRGVHEYWILDWQRRQVDVYRRREAALHLVATLYAEDVLESPLLPGFACPVGQLFAGIP